MLTDMLTHILYSLDETALIAGVVLIFIKSFFSPSNPKFALKIAEIFTIISLTSSVIFYNKGIFPIYFETSVYTTISYTLTAVMAIMCLRLCRLWVEPEQNLNTTFYAVWVLIALLALNIVIKTHNLQTLFIGLIILIVSQFFLLKLNQSSEALHHFGRNFGLIGFLMIALLGVVVFYLGNKQCDYADAAGAFSLFERQKQALFMAGTFCPVFLMLGIAPFHFSRTDHIASLSLPVASFFALVPMMGLFAALLKLNTAFFVFFEKDLQNVYFFFGILSMIVSVIGINSSRFLNKIFAFCGLYALANAFLVLALTAPEAGITTFLYIEFYLLFTLGIYICFYALKSNGVYINHVAQMAGLSKTRPYIAAFMTFFVLIFMAVPPLTGMLAWLVVLRQTASSPLVLYICLFALLAMMPVFFKILQNLYFKKKENTFDRVDAVLYFYLFCVAALCVVVLLKPQQFLAQLYLLSVK